MTLPRRPPKSLSCHVVFEPDCIDRIYCVLYVPKLRASLVWTASSRDHLDKPAASTAVLVPGWRRSTPASAASPPGVAPRMWSSPPGRAQHLIPAASV
jgi:hypothetical protein